MKFIIKLILFPFVIALIFLKPIINFKFIHISSETLGHFTIDTFLNFLNKKEEFRVGLLRINIFLINDIVCNTYLLYLWKKKIFIINRNIFLRKFESLVLLFKLHRFFFKKKLNQMENSKIMILKSPPFNKNDFDQTQANNLCDKIGLDINKKWICVHNRDNNYNNHWLNSKLSSKEISDYNIAHNYRNFKLIDIN